MPEIKVKQCEPKTIPLGIPMQLSVYVEKGSTEILFRSANGATKAEKLISGEKKIWDKDALMSFANFDFISLTDLSIIHYHLDRL